MTSGEAERMSSREKTKPRKPGRKVARAKQRATKIAPPAGRARHRAGTERDLIEAVGAVLAAEDGPLSLSSVARHAGVDKALVYRYFGSFEGLLDAYVKDSTYWPAAADVAFDPDALRALPLGVRFVTVLQRYARALRARPETLAILAAELSGRAAFPRVFQLALEARREAFGRELFELSLDAPPGLDVAALASVATGSLHYLLIRARQVELFNGIPLAKDEGWARIEAALEAAVLGAVADSGRSKQLRRR
jgi:AcrR family transcriptional regulator